MTGSTYGYSSENLLTTATANGSAVTVAYDPLMRMIQATGSLGPIRFAYDGLDMVGEYDGANTLLRRYVFGPGADEPIVIMCRTSRPCWTRRRTRKRRCACGAPRASDGRPGRTRFSMRSNGVMGGA